MKDKILAIEGLRGWAALMVLLSHGVLSFFPYLHSGELPERHSALESWIYNSPLAFVYSGSAAVCIFFVLSGYILSVRLLASGQPAAQASAMAVKRYFRLMPPALLSCLIAWGVFHFEFFGVERSLLSGWMQEYGRLQASLGGALFQGSIGAFLLADSSYNWPLWTMKFELFGSLLVFALCPLLPYLRYPRLVLALLGAALVYVMPASEGLLYALFLFGMALALRDNRMRTSTALLLVALALYCGSFNEGDPLHQPFAWLQPSLRGVALEREYLFNGLAGVALCWAVLRHPWLNRLFSARPLVKLGEWSFAAYLLHMPVMACVGAALLGMLAPLLGYTLAGSVALAASLLSIYLLAVPYARWVDQGTQRFASRVGKLLLRQP